MAHQVLPFRLYLNVFIALLFLTVITVAVAQVDFGGSLNAIIAMVVATVKATLVAMYFMNLKYESRMSTVCFVAGFFFLIVMYMFIAIDEASRVIGTSTL